MSHSARSRRTLGVEVHGLGVGEGHIVNVDHGVAAVQLGLLPQLLDRKRRLWDGRGVGRGAWGVGRGGGW